MLANHPPIRASLPKPPHHFACADASMMQPLLDIVLYKSRQYSLHFAPPKYPRQRDYEVNKAQKISFAAQRWNGDGHNIRSCLEHTMMYDERIELRLNSLRAATREVVDDGVSC